jgi:hypothetical protein
MENLGRYLILGGIVLVLVGVGLYLGARLGIPWGRLPGDVTIAGDKGSFHFPIATSIVLSIILTLALNVLLRIFRK